MEAKSPVSSDWTHINEFLDKQLRSNVSWSLKDEYPLAFQEKNRGNIRVIKKDGQVVAHAVVHPVLIKTHYHVFKVGLIGSVVTDESLRGQGSNGDITVLRTSQAKESNVITIMTILLLRVLPSLPFLFGHLLHFPFV